MRAQIKRYNRDDCVSTLRLRDWLEEQRAALAAELGDLPRQTVPEPEQVEDSEAQQAVNQLVDALAAGLPGDAGDRSDGRTWALAAGAASELAPPRGEVVLVALLLPAGRAHRRGAPGRNPTLWAS